MGKLSNAIRLKKLKKANAEPYKISEESALEQVVEILDYYDIPIERFEQSEKTEQAGENILDSLVACYRKGQLQNVRTDKEILNIIQTTQSGETITYQEVGSKQKKIMDKYPTENYKRMYAFLGSLCGLGSDAIEQLKAGRGQNDLACAEFLGSLFLAV